MQLSDELKENLIKALAQFERKTMKREDLDKEVGELLGTSGSPDDELRAVLQDLERAQSEIAAASRR